MKSKSKRREKEDIFVGVIPPRKIPAFSRWLSDDFHGWIVD